MQRRTVLTQALKSAGDVMMAHWQKVKRGTLKMDGSVVSSVDLLAEKRIIQIIRQEYPRDTLLSEESGGKSRSVGYRWIIDPLDGTHNFLAGLPLFGCLIALEHQGMIVMGGCWFPIINELFFAQRGKGAYRNGKKIRVSRQRNTRGAMLLSDGNVRSAKKSIFSDMTRCAHSKMRLRILGSSAYSQARVASGDAILATNRTAKPWDIAATSLIVQEAGGVVSDFDGRPWTINSRQIISTTSYLHSDILKIFKS